MKDVFLKINLMTADIPIRNQSQVLTQMCLPLPLQIVCVNFFFTK
jgi:hypothetical protein